LRFSLFLRARNRIIPLVESSCLSMASERRSNGVAKLACCILARSSLQSVNAVLTVNDMTRVAVPSAYVSPIGGYLQPLITDRRNKYAAGKAALREENAEIRSREVFRYLEARVSKYGRTGRDYQRRLVGIHRPDSAHSASIRFSDLARRISAKRLRSRLER